MHSAVILPLINTNAVILPLNTNIIILPLNTKIVILPFIHPLLQGASNDEIQNFPSPPMAPATPKDKSWRAVIKTLLPANVSGCPKP